MEIGTKEHSPQDFDLQSIGREIGARRMRSVGAAVRAVFSLASMVVASDALAQGGPCLTSCDDGGWLPGWIITPPGDNGGFGGNDPCGGHWCDGGGGNDIPPDDVGGGTTTPVAGIIRRVPNNPYSNNPATCSSDEMERVIHAQQDIALYYSEHMTTVRRGDIMEVEYDDGSKERYILVALPNSSYGGTFLERIPGSMTGCATGT